MEVEHGSRSGSRGVEVSTSTSTRWRAGRRLPWSRFPLSMARLPQSRGSRVVAVDDIHDCTTSRCDFHRLPRLPTPPYKTDTLRIDLDRFYGPSLLRLPFFFMGLIVTQ